MTGCELPLHADESRESLCLNSKHFGRCHEFTICAAVNPFQHSIGTTWIHCNNRFVCITLWHQSIGAWRSSSRWNAERICPGSEPELWQPFYIDLFAVSGCSHFRFVCGNYWSHFQSDAHKLCWCHLVVHLWHPPFQHTEYERIKKTFPRRNLKKQ